MHLEIQLAAYYNALDYLLNHQSQYVKELNVEFQKDYEVRCRSQRTIYHQYKIGLDKFVKVGQQNLEQFDRTGDFSKIRVCMLLNQYVLGDQRVKDAVRLTCQQTNMGSLATIEVIYKLVMDSFKQLKCDLLEVKSVLPNGAKDGGTIDEFEHFATNMAVIKVNHLMNNEVRDGHVMHRNGEFEHLIDSPNDTRLVDIRLRQSIQRQNIQVHNNQMQNETGHDSQQQSDAGRNFRRKFIGRQFPKGKKEIETNDKPQIVLDSFHRKQLKYLRGQVRKLVCALEALESATQTILHLSEQTSKYWWKMLGNNDYDYGVRYYLEKSHGHQIYIVQLLEYVRSAIIRWNRVDSAMSHLNRKVERSIRSHRQSQHQTPHETQSATELTCQSQCQPDPQCQCDSQSQSQCQSHRCLVEFFSLSNCGSECMPFRDLLLSSMQIEAVACVNYNADLWHHMCNKLSEHQWSKYDQIVYDYNSSVTFTEFTIGPPPSRSG